MLGFHKQRFYQYGMGTLPRVEGVRRTVVVGGGLAGIAAAVVLAERGVSVTLIEKESYLGGRVCGWTDQFASGEPFEMERGFHAFFRQYYNLRSLLKRIDPKLKTLIPLKDYPVYGPGGAIQSFERLPKLPPLNVAVLTKRTPTLGLRDLMKADTRAAIEMLHYNPDKTYANNDNRTAREYLDSLNFPPQARRMLFDVFSHSFFNPEEDLSAAEMLMMFHFYFMGNPEGLIFDVLCEPFSDALWRPFARYLKNLGVTIRTSTSATSIAREGDGWRVDLDGDQAPENADAVVLAVTVPALQQITSASPDLGDTAWRESIRKQSLTLPFVVWRMWLDNPLEPDRYPFVGTAGLGIIDNISAYETFEGESRRWAMRTGGSVVELHAYAVSETHDEASIREELLGRLHELYPETREAKVLEERYLLRQDCPAFKQNSYVDRPTVETPNEGICLAGDFVRTPVPSALMERATITGFLAANQILGMWNGLPEPIWSVPQVGILEKNPRRN